MTAAKTALVTGGAGYIGSHVALALLGAGWTVVVIDDLSTGSRMLVPAEAVFVEGDIGDPAAIGETLGRYRPDVILHFAGSIIVAESVTEPLKYYRNNTAASLTLIEAAVAHGVGSFVFSSTAAVYGVPERVPISENSLTAPINPYGASKLCTEFVLRDVAAATPMRYIALRYFNVAGADPACRTGETCHLATHLVKIACEAVVGKRSHIAIYGDDYPTPDGTCVRDYIHVSDLADAHVTAVEHLLAGGAGGVFNCGYGHGYSVKEVIDVVQQVGGRLDVRLAPRRPGDPPVLTADSTRLCQDLGWRPKYDDLRFIVETALVWERRLQTMAA
ncbi:MAG: UDP-glucose 4-epimerase GalE [Rhodospirillales bacterium]